MKLRFKMTAHAAAGLLAMASWLGAQTNPPAQKAGAQTPPKASIEGTVTDAGQGKPVKDVNLLLVDSSGSGGMTSAKSDETGAFTFKNVEPGTYLLMGDHARYARQTYGSRNGLLGGTPLTVIAGQELKQVNFKLLANGVASGKVLDEDGEPMPKVMVLALKKLYQRGKPQFLPVGTGVTNDVGEFRVGNLAPGRYLLSANLINPGAGAPAKPADDKPETTYVTTYYPNAPDAAGGSPVTVSAGADVGGMDIRMIKTKSVRIKGKVLGAPKDQTVNVSLIQKSAGLLSVITAPKAVASRTDGAFEVVGATPGSYTLRASDQSGMKAFGSGIPIQVGDQKIEGVVLEIAAGSDLSGTVIVEGDSKPSLKGGRVMLEASEGISAVPPMATLGEDGAFSIKDLVPDQYFVRVLNGPQNSYVASVRAGGQDMAENGLPLGGPAGKVEVKLRMGAALVNGVVNGADDKPISGVTVALIPESGQYLHYQSTFTDQNGAFTFKSVTPGEYKVLAWEEVEPNAFQDPEFLRPFEGKAEKVSVKENDRKAVTLKAVPRQ